MPVFGRCLPEGELPGVGVRPDDPLNPGQVSAPDNLFNPANRYNPEPPPIGSCVADAT